jgi:hypothetical protein
MTSRITHDRAIARSAIAIGFAALATGIVLAVASAARANSKPVGPLPPGPISTITTAPEQLVAVALSRAPSGSGLVWRLARHYNSHVVRQVSEANIAKSVVLVYKVVGRGDTSLVFALTRGDNSPRALKAATHTIHSR